MKIFDSIIKKAIDKNASDIHIQGDHKISFRIKGAIDNLNISELLSSAIIENALKDNLPNSKYDLFNKNGDIDFSHEINYQNQIYRCRINAYNNIKGISVAIRILPTRIPTLKELRLPAYIERLATLKKGLVLLSGPMGSGKSTTLAALTEIINQNRQENIVTLEDPIEYVYSQKKSIISQREIGTHSIDFNQGLKSCFREDANVVILGEIRDTDSIQTALRLAETGVLVLSTIHAGSVIEAIDRIKYYFSDSDKPLLLNTLSICLEAIIVQKLVLRKDGSDRIVIPEIMQKTPAIQAKIRSGKYLNIIDDLRSSPIMCSMQDIERDYKNRSII